jgi:ferredoxin
MSAPQNLSRRAFLGLLRRQEAPEAPAPAPMAEAPAAPREAFSLEAFYAARSRQGEAGTAGRLPVFSLREGLVVARVRPERCLAWQGSFCSTCSERCPAEGAITLELGRPRVEASRCNGCGYCAQVCPAPLKAFEFLPSAQQVSPP